MVAKPPPVPPAQRSDKGPGSSPRTPADTTDHHATPGNLGEQDRQGNIAQNTTSQGHQQDR